jgi:hypothetical protein
MRRQVGNFPQAFSRIALIITALNLHDCRSGVTTRARRHGTLLNFPQH